MRFIFKLLCESRLGLSAFWQIAFLDLVFPSAGTLTTLNLRGCNLERGAVPFARALRSSPSSALTALDLRDNVRTPTLRGSTRMIPRRRFGKQNRGFFLLQQIVEWTPSNPSLESK